MRTNHLDPKSVVFLTILFLLSGSFTANAQAVFNANNGNFNFLAANKFHKVGTDGSADGNVTLYFKNGGFMSPLVINVLHSTSGNGPTIYDGSGNSYPTVYIGSQHWMAKNLTTTKYNDETTISNVQNGVEWKDVRTGAWSDYENNLTNGSNYGKLYNGYAMQTQKLCPTGWHIPTKIEWDTLFNYLGGIQVAGSKLKAVSNLFEAGANTDATNASNFSGLLPFAPIVRFLRVMRDR
jgi:uncharacterized protein (TIGR02145 family)